MAITSPGIEASQEDLTVNLCFAIGPLLLGGIAAYVGLSLPHENNSWLYPANWPPLWLFWAVWIVIYPCWGHATYLIWRLRNIYDVRGVLVLFGANLVASCFFLPVAGLSGQHPGVMTMGDLNGVLQGLLAAWLYTRYEKRTIWFLAPLLIWMPITTGLKLLYWSVN